MNTENYKSQMFVLPKITDGAVQRKQIIAKSKKEPGKHVVHFHPYSETCQARHGCDVYENGEKIGKVYQWIS